MDFEIIDTGKNTALKNMEIDRNLLDSVFSFKKPILHFYEWANPSVTYGHFIKHESYLKPKEGVDFAVRPTGGGVLFHVADFAFSLLIPAHYPAFSLNTLDNYALVNEWVIEVLKKCVKGTPYLMKENQKDSCCNFCMGKATIYDVMLEGKKVGGAAQRRTKMGLLHQGTLSLAMPPESLLKDVLVDLSIIESMKTNGHYLLGPGANAHQINEMRASLKNCMDFHSKI